MGVSRELLDMTHWLLLAQRARAFPIRFGGNQGNWRAQSGAAPWGRTFFWGPRRRRTLGTSCRRVTRSHLGFRSVALLPDQPTSS